MSKYLNYWGEQVSRKIEIYNEAREANNTGVMARIKDRIIWMLKDEGRGEEDIKTILTTYCIN
jgi:hypothetical protein